MLIERHAPPMLRLAERTIGNAADADEVMQESFLKVWQQASNWRADGRAKFSTWLYRVVLNASIDRHRKKTMQPLDTIDAPDVHAQDGQETALAHQRSELIRGAIETMPKRQREALMLFYFAELTAPDAAKVLDISLQAMESLLVRGRRALGDELRRRGVFKVGDVL